jgi:regulatory protein
MPGRKPRLLDGPQLLAYAVRSLGARAQSSGELRARLVRRAAEASDVSEIMAKLADGGLLNDAQFAESFAAARRDNQSQGRIRVMRDLRQRRVTPQIAEKAVREAFEDTDEIQLIDQYLARKLRGKDLPRYLAEEKNLASAYRRLRTAGFASGTSIKVLKRYAARADELEDSPSDATDESATDE